MLELVDPDRNQRVFSRWLAVEKLIWTHTDSQRSGI